MNILVLNYEFPPLGGGAAPVSRDIAYQYSKMGHKAVVVTMGYGDLPSYEISEGVEIYRLKCWRSRKSACMPWEQYTYIMAVRKFMRRHMKQRRYDICHTHFVIPTGAAARWVKRKYGLPYVITAHGSDVEGHNPKLSMKVMHRVLRRAWRGIVSEAGCVVAPSVYLQGLMERSYAAGRYIHIPNGIEWEKFHSLAERQNKKKNILVMGRLQSFKNVQTVIRALAAAELGEWRIDILGDGPCREELERLTEESGLAGRVAFRGWIDNGTPEQLQYIERASIYISASRIENCPMSVIETIAAGCYPLLSDIPAHRQLVDREEYFFQADDVRGLARKITDAIRISENGGAGIPDVSAYDWTCVMRKYIEVLEENRREGNG